jgi:hypothetical protein
VDTADPDGALWFDENVTHMIGVLAVTFDTHDFNVTASCPELRGI